ncbi:MAG TPA: STAS domain-containing protein [Pseudonocardiaceae bacterium]|nr:STAS domain-containing protein [Pseudonocardiaceae bacterium]
MLHVTGELDMVTAPAVAAEVARQFGPEGSVDDRTLVFDLTGTSFLASSGLAVLADAAKEAARRSLPKVRVVAANRPVLRPIQVTGLDTVLEVYADLTAALQQPAGD